VTWLLQFCFLALIDFALGGITFFILAILDLFPDSPDTTGKDAYTFVLLNNLYEATFAVVVINVVLEYAQKIRRKWLQYIVLLLALHFTENLVEEILFEKNPGFISFCKSLIAFHPAFFIFQIHILIASCLVYYLYTRERTRTRKITEQEYQLLLLQELKTKAELEALQAKINPHFLYNALNSIAGLVHLDPDKAEKMVLLLSKFFRYSTQVKNHYHSTLAEELEMVRTYLEVEQVRFEDRLAYNIELENEDLNQAKIPSFLLQPLVENAIKHGISKIAEQGVIHIKVYEENNQLCIHIHDNGAPFPENINSGYGLQSAQDKLRLLGGKNAAMEISNEPEKHILITIFVIKQPCAGAEGK
jgi:sensor histidine kinase YesM